jgi:NitT/TauT family transport system ATP-binding protein
MNPVLTLDHVSYSYHTPSGETPALKDISFSVRPGSFTSIAGPSGCGKSTLLSLIAGLIAPEKGCIRFYKSDAMPAAARIGYMLQHDTLLEWRTIYKNILLGLEVTHQCTEQKKRLAADMMHDYGLASFKNAHPSELSGGMRQRAALIRTLVLEPDILLLDEPFSALDYQTRLEVSDDIFRIIKEQEKTALLVTHDISEAIAMGEQVIVLSSRPAGIKNVFDIHLSVDKRTPFSSRTAPEFSAYFHQIWKELS